MALAQLLMLDPWYKIGVGRVTIRVCSLFNLSPFAARCGVDLWEVWRLCIYWCRMVCYCSSDNLAHAYAP
jgi:hypothetical protein